jgi:hypothetical protein
MLNKITTRRNGFYWTVSKPVSHMPGYVREWHFNTRSAAWAFVRQLKEMQ